MLKIMKRWFILAWDSIKTLQPIRWLHGIFMSQILIKTYALPDTINITEPKVNDNSADIDDIDNNKNSSKTVTQQQLCHCFEQPDGSQAVEKKTFSSMGVKKSKIASSYKKTSENFIMEERTKIFSVGISEGSTADQLLFRLQKGSILRIHADVELLGREIMLYTNYPAKNEKFIRTHYRILDWYHKEHKVTTQMYQFAHIIDTDLYCEVHLEQSGTYKFWFRYRENDTNEPDGFVFIQVEPTLLVGHANDQKVIQLNSVRCQTVISKLLGPLNTWESKLRVAKECGYNMVHFTPIQELGSSKSAYSLRHQLKVNQNFANESGTTIDFDDIGEIIQKMRREWEIASICDIVLNHTANESDWVREHPEVTYSCATCPYLRPAFLLDAILTRCGQDIAVGKLESVGVPRIIDREIHLEALKYRLENKYLAKVNLHELYQCDIIKYINEFVERVRKSPPPKHVANHERFHEIKIQTDPEYRRLGATINIELAFEIFNGFHPECFDEDARIRKCSEQLRTHLEQLNEEVRCEIQAYVNYALENCIASVRYERVAEDGPMIREISETHPVFMQYFTQTGTEGCKFSAIEEGMYTEMGKYFMAHNGWVMGHSDPLHNFADRQPGHGNVYLKRELIAWGDSVKLRYGQEPKDNPYLWNHMTEYVEIIARIFDGVRLDNCHSTPIHVAEYLLDAARAINSELYVVAELFTNSDATDNIFVNRLGITSLIREALSAWDAHELGRLVYRYGGEPVGAFNVNPQRDLAATVAHAMFLDWTHDNPSPIDKRSVYDLVPSAGLVSMSSCATGSNRGYDELVPHHIHVVTESRQYQEWEKGVDMTTGMIGIKRALNMLHGKLSEDGFNQVYVDQMDPNIVAVTRHSPSTHESVIMVVHTAFSYPQPCAGPTGVRPLRFEGSLDEIILEADISSKEGRPYERPGEFKKNEKYINGFTQFQINLREHIPLNESKIFRDSACIDGNVTQLDFVNLRPGSVVIIKTSLKSDVHLHCQKLQQISQSLLCEESDAYENLLQIIQKLNLVDLNYALFVCDQEERDHDMGNGAYDIPGYGPVVYCGLQGFVSILTEVAPKNDLGHWLCNNLRDGNWMMNYLADRLANYKNLKDLAIWLQSTFDHLKNIPRYLIPCYFDVIVSAVHKLLVKRVIDLMPESIRNGHSFEQSLALTTVQLLSVIKSVNLPTLSPAISPPKPPQQFVTLSAGLPHFSIGYMRCWGRDTFISLRALLLVTKRFDEARYIILGFAQCLRHGLIPNLLDSGNKPRYNCRDAVWWWFHSIHEYTRYVPDGKNILNEMVSRIFPYDDSEPHTAGKFEQHLYEVMQEALQVHFQGLQYRERNAGYEIDAHMTDKGFNNEIGVHPETGFVFGGNNANCGTWMDKMGSSEKAGNRGRPSTPRDGSAVELVGLQMAALRFMQSLSENKIIPYNSVKRQGPNGQITVWTYKEWAERILLNFEKYFFVTANEKAPLANKKNIYKDSYGATKAWTDYQLRCNFPIAMVVAPELFNPQNAWLALEQAREHLLGPLGMKTLDPNDYNYRGNYDNSNDSNDGSVAHGANYHQGPEWIWPIGYYLRARLIFAKKCGFLKETIAETWRILRAHVKEVNNSHWRGISELTNANGSYCSDSCRTQAWSNAVIIEVLHDLHAYGGDVANA